MLLASRPRLQWRRMRGSLCAARNSSKACFRERGRYGLLSAWATTKWSSVSRIPSRGSSCAWRTRWPRNSSTTLAGNATVRPLPLFGGLYRTAVFVCSAFLDRDLRPVQVDVAPAQPYGLAAANPGGDAKQNRNEQSRVPRRLDQVAVWSVSWTVILRRSTLGSLTASAGLRAYRFHLTTCWRACFTRGCGRNDVETSGVS
jgi:hypothetical protein